MVSKKAWTAGRIVSSSPPPKVSKKPRSAESASACCWSGGDGSGSAPIGEVADSGYGLLAPMEPELMLVKGLKLRLGTCWKWGEGLISRRDDGRGNPKSAIGASDGMANNGGDGDGLYHGARGAGRTGAGGESVGE